MSSVQNELVHVISVKHLLDVFDEIDISQTNQNAVRLPATRTRTPTNDIGRRKRSNLPKESRDWTSVIGTACDNPL